MALTSKELKELETLLRRAQELIGKATDPADAKSASKPSARRAARTRIRRSGKDLIAFRKAIRAERKAGVPVAKIAEKHGISPAYIYQLG
jgi:hypothetical protein